MQRLHGMLQSHRVLPRTLRHSSLSQASPAPMMTLMMMMMMRYGWHCVSKHQHVYQLPMTGPSQSS